MSPKILILQSTSCAPYLLLLSWLILYTPIVTNGFATTDTWKTIRGSTEWRTAAASHTPQAFKCTAAAPSSKNKNPSFTMWGPSSYRRKTTLASESDKVSSLTTTYEEIPMNASLADSASSGMREELRKGSSRVAVLLCPAQFCVPNDYDEFFLKLRQLSNYNNGPRIGTCQVAPLPRTEWIKVARQLPTRAFLEARLPVVETLGWYFDSIETALADIFAKEGDQVKICFVGHSIGGWVARAYLGGLSKSSTAVYRLALKRCTSLITLGTPHTSPDEALVDQTRGLLRAIDEAPNCSPRALAERGIALTCVGSSGMKGRFFTTNVEELVAASSYLPLLGRLDDDISGDGIVPLELALLPSPARRVVLERCSLSNEPIRHSHVVPTPWNLWDGYAPSIRLASTFPSYVSDGVLPQWIQYIR